VSTFNLHHTRGPGIVGIEEFPSRLTFHLVWVNATVLEGICPELTSSPLERRGILLQVFSVKSGNYFCIFVFILFLVRYLSTQVMLSLQNLSSGSHRDKLRPVASASPASLLLRDGPRQPRWYRRPMHHRSPGAQHFSLEQGQSLLSKTARE